MKSPTPQNSFIRIFFVSFLAFNLLSFNANAEVRVKGYYRKNGTYVAPHYRSSPNKTVRDNYSYKGNINPHTGKVGTNYYRDNPTSEYYQGIPTYNDNSYSERQDNLRTCLSGQHRLLCEHSLLSKEEAEHVAKAERQDNLRTCLSGQHRLLCDHSLLSKEEAEHVAKAERQDNLRTCLSGQYPSLCNHSLLSREEAYRVAEAENFFKY